MLLRALHSVIFSVSLISILSLFGCRSQQRIINPSPFEKEIAVFEQKTATERPKAGQILLYGSSSMRLWDSFAQDLQGFSVINRGFGGSQMSDAIAYFDRVVMPLQPGTIILYEGDNDLASGESVDEIYKEFKQLIKLIESKLPKTKLVFVSLRPSVARINLLSKQQELNAQVQKYCLKYPEKADYIDVHKLLLNADGKPDPRYLVADQLHLNVDGYRVWANEIRAYLQKAKH